MDGIKPDCHRVKRKSRSSPSYQNMILPVTFAQAIRELRGMSILHTRRLLHVSFSMLCQADNCRCLRMTFQRFSHHLCPRKRGPIYIPAVHFRARARQMSGHLFSPSTRLDSGQDGCQGYRGCCGGLERNLREGRGDVEEERFGSRLCSDL
jgi:hypothetical protein